MSGVLYKSKFGWGNLFGRFFLQFCLSFLDVNVIFCRVRKLSTQSKDPQKKSRNSDFETETLLEGVGESLGIHSKGLNKFLGLPMVGIPSFHGIEFLLRSRVSILRTPNRIKHFFDNWIH